MYVCMRERKRGEKENTCGGLKTAFRSFFLIYNEF